MMGAEPCRVKSQAPILPALMSETHLIVLCTVPDTATADRIAAALVEERLAACVNALAGVSSTYRWEGKVQRGTEVLLVIKTAADRFTALATRIRSLHPYSVPEIVALPLAAGSHPYLDWITECTRP